MTSPAKPRSLEEKIQDEVMRELQQHTRRRTTEMTPWRRVLAVVLGLLCLVMPIQFGRFAWQRAQAGLATQAAARGDLSRMTALLQQHAELAGTPGYLQRTPLWWAAANGRLNILQLLLQRGVDINASDLTGWTPLCAAAAHNRVDAMEQLQAAGALLTASDRHMCSALHAAATGANLDAATFLCEHQADVNAVDARGWTPLHVAVQANQTAMAAFLLDHGANVKAVTQDGLTPLQLANAMKKHDDIINLLIERGGE